VRVAVASLKVGVGKTTTAVYLAAVVARGRRKVPIVDADPQRVGRGLVEERPIDGVEVREAPSERLLRKPLGHRSTIAIDPPARLAPWPPRPHIGTKGPQLLGKQAIRAPMIGATGCVSLSVRRSLHGTPSASRSGPASRLFAAGKIMGRLLSTDYHRGSGLTAGSGHIAGHTAARSQPRH
jgi:hypothetical protein